MARGCGGIVIITLGLVGPVVTVVSVAAGTPIRYSSAVPVPRIIVVNPDAPGARVVTREIKPLDGSVVVVVSTGGVTVLVIPSIGGVPTTVVGSDSATKGTPMIS